ncbi:phasin family protein [Paenibacillus tarimensis]|uniref:phasin family protein n=1 Tax=Paenibacillus tarimensis TaxID=416012 RepID=UPI001F48D1D0|nr:polyhydroxyalkanoate synthesis regulator [Paenibacillus tarimensis]MCF2944581.1 polyhydroxyalkanoate synthesis regulator [Paenibacillus tarimensis]
MNELLKKALSLGVGITVTSKEKVEKYVDELVRKGEVAPTESKALVNRLVQRGEEEQTQIKQMIREQLQQLLVELNMATKEDIARLEKRVEKLEQPLPPLEPSSASANTGQEASVAPSVDPQP